MRGLCSLSCSVRGWGPSTASAQVAIPPAAMVDRVDDVIRQGELLERERRWGDALAYYEDAIKNHPNRDELRQRLDVARTHLDVARRFADQSYLASLRTSHAAGGVGAVLGGPAEDRHVPCERAELEAPGVSGCRAIWTLR